MVSFFSNSTSFCLIFSRLSGISQCTLSGSKSRSMAMMKRSQSTSPMISRDFFVFGDMCEAGRLTARLVFFQVSIDDSEV